MGYPNWEPPVIITDWESANWEYSRLGTHSSTNNWENLKILYTQPSSLNIATKTCHFFETVQVFSNPTAITQSSANLQWNKNHH